MHILKNMTGPHPPDRFFEEMARELIRDCQRKTDENQEEQAGFSFFPKDPDSQDNEDINEVPRFRHERHEPIEERALPLAIDQPKKSYIQRGKKGKHRFDLSCAENTLPCFDTPSGGAEEAAISHGRGFGSFRDDSIEFSATCPCLFSRNFLQPEF
jgi:hypothetical protein